MATAKEKFPTNTATLEEEPRLTYLDFLTQTGDAVLKSITESQEQFLSAAKQIAENQPKAPDFALPVVEGAPEVQVPSARELFDVSFAFADKFLASQKAYAEKYLALTGA